MKNKEADLILEHWLSESKRIEDAHTAKLKRIDRTAKIMTFTVLAIFPVAICLELAWIYYKSSTTPAPPPAPAVTELDPEHWGTKAVADHEITSIIYYLREQGNSRQELTCQTPVEVKKGEFFTWKELFQRCGGEDVFATVISDEQKRVETGEAKLTVSKE